MLYKQFILINLHTIIWNLKSNKQSIKAWCNKNININLKLKKKIKFNLKSKFK